MDRIVDSLTVRGGRAHLNEGRARRLEPGANRPAFTLPGGGPPARQEERPVAGWAGLVTAGRTGPAAPDAQPPAAPAVPAPDLESVFGPQPWMTAPAGRGPLGVYYFNPVYFATAQTAAKVAELLGGKVIQQNALCGSPGSPFEQLQPNYMVELPNGRVTNPGLVATYYMRGYPQPFIDRLLDIERAEAKV